MRWHPCVGYPSFEISEWGDLRRCLSSRTRTIGDRPRGFIDSDGYLRYILRDEEGGKRSICAHVLVALSFIGPPPSPSHEVAHNNGSKVCCHYSELRWASRMENHADIEVHGTSPVRGERNPHSKVTEEQVKEIRREYRKIKNSRTRSVSELDKKYGLHRATILKIARGKTWTHVPMEEFDAQL